EEAKVAGYTTEVGDLTEGKITVTNTQKTTEVEVDKKWVNADGSETWPAGVTVSIQLTADKEAVAGKTATLNADQTSYKFTSLPKYKVVDGKEVEIEYSVEEAKVAGYTTEVGDLTEGKTTVTNTQETVEVIVTKVWEDQDDAHGLRPDSIIINLLADGEQLNRAVLDGKVDGEDEAGYEKKAWVATFSSLPKYQADGTTKIKYTVTENAVQGYITVIELKAEEADAVEETENVTETAEAETAESETSETEDTETETEKDGPIEYTVTNTLISLEITKEVQNLFDAGGTSNATFVFEVKIGTKYHNYAAIIFDGKAGTDSTVLYGLPYEEGDTITVEEVYTAGHKLVSQTAVTWDGEDKIFKVSFVNTYNNTPGYGSGIINEYSHDEKGNPVVTNQSKQNTVS
ncbi:MAG: Cna B-type domain-containing protein, partial [Oscillospiraceae bacterium]|nr:Cna B-type domain-containing protein [Oscillospiraceae bacterium]